MSGAAWFPFWGRDFLASTLGWSAEERGHYVTLLVAQWEQDGLPDDVKRLELISPGVKACWSSLAEKFPVSTGGRRRNPRLEHERHKANERSALARESASRRWSKGAVEAKAEGESIPKKCERICDGICGGICDGTCGKPCETDASIAISYSPPPPPPPRAENGEENAPETDSGKAPAEAPPGWDALRSLWNATWGEKRAWRSMEPPHEAIARLREPGWLEEALAAIPEIKRGLCSGFDTPPTLRQFCKRDDRGTFVARMLGGEFTDQSAKRGRKAVAP